MKKNKSEDKMTEQKHDDQNEKVESVENEVTDVESVEVPEESELEKIEKERNEFKDKWLRALAEFDNYRKNTLKEKQDWIKYSNEKIILELCEVLDNFERALATEISSDNFSAYVKGVEMIFQQLNTILKKNDVVKIEALGKEFDPNYHDALSSIPANEPQNTVVAIIQNGYMVGEKVIRASRVAVSNGEKPEIN